MTDFGAVGDGRTDCTAAIIAAVAAASRRAARTSRKAAVRFGRGLTFLTRPFNLTSGLVVQVDGTIRAATGDAAQRQWPRLPPLPTYGRDRDGAKRWRHQALIMAEQAHGVVIRGRGTIDGQGAWWWTRRRELRGGRPHLLEFYNCTRVELAGVTLRDSPFWTVHPVYSSWVHVHDVTIRAPLYAPNTDGIDPDSSRHVLIERCDISCGDDHVAIKAGLNAHARDGFPRYVTENVTVRHNVLRTGMGVSVGSETSGGIRDVRVLDNVFRGDGSWCVPPPTSRGWRRVTDT